MGGWKVCVSGWRSWNLFSGTLTVKQKVAMLLYCWEIRKHQELGQKTNLSCLWKERGWLSKIFNSLCTWWKVSYLLYKINTSLAAALSRRITKLIFIFQEPLTKVKENRWNFNDSFYLIQPKYYSDMYKNDLWSTFLCVISSKDSLCCTSKCMSSPIYSTANAQHPHVPVLSTVLSVQLLRTGRKIKRQKNISIAVYTVKMPQTLIVRLLRTENQTGQ